jgi:NAD(P)-dependent dehydrogenase (short-subunit alcohol dehydrogenase family)
LKTILVLGGYGTFGGRIARRAAAGGFRVLVAGRDFAKAEAFCGNDPALVPLCVAGSSLDEVLAEHRPFALVDAAGPFQSSGYDVAEAALKACCHYLDIADATAFVAGMAALDAAAKRAGISLISGASSVPALSGAVVRGLAVGLDRVTAVEMALSASSRGTAGLSVTAAILSYLGSPIALRRGGRPSAAFGWQELRRADFAVEGAPPLRRRLVAMADVPDLRLLPERLAGAPTVEFRAGTDAPWHNVGLWLLSWPVRWGWLRRPQRFAATLSRLQRWTRGRGSLRSAFSVRLWGVAGGRRLERAWTLLAEAGDGPEIPSLAVPILLRRLADGDLPPGAGDAGTALSLTELEPALATLHARWTTTERDLPPPLYARAMGDAFDRLPPALREIHSMLRDGGASGEATVTRGTHPLARLVAGLIGFPPAGAHRLHVCFRERDGGETWARDFSGRIFSSRLSMRAGRLTERFGPLAFAFDLLSDAHGLEMVIRRWWLGPLPLPLLLAPRSRAREWEEDGRFHFDVPIALPLIGDVVRYRGWLVPVTASAS